jgi:uncharacterized protein (TIGR02001 family)
MKSVLWLSISMTCAALLAGETVRGATVAGTSVDVTASASVVSHYMFRGLRLNAAGFQPSVELAAGSWQFGVWSNLPLRDEVRDSSDPESDFFGAYTFRVNDRVSVAPGFTSYHFPRAPTNAGYYRSTFEPNLAVHYTGPGFRITPKVHYDTVLDGFTVEVSGVYAYPLTRWGTELNLLATVGTYRWDDYTRDAAPAVKAWGDYWLLGVSIPVQITRQSKITAGFAYTEGREAFTKAGPAPKLRNPLAAGRGVVTLTYAFAF